jgi:hypothetical protein
MSSMDSAFVKYRIVPIQEYDRLMSSENRVQKHVANVKLALQNNDSEASILNRLLGPDFQPNRDMPPAPIMNDRGENPDKRVLPHSLEGTVSDTSLPPPPPLPPNPPMQLKRQISLETDNESDYDDNRLAVLKSAVSIKGKEQNGSGRKRLKKRVSVKKNKWTSKTKAKRSLESSQPTFRWPKF